MDPRPMDAILLNALSLYFGTGVCLLALVLTRQAYKLSPGYRTRLGATGFHELPLDAPAPKKAGVMLAVLRDAWPATVSEMLMDTEAAHGMVFRSLMVAGCLACMQCDFASLAPPAAAEVPRAVGAAIGLVHLLRRLILSTAVGFCFAPVTGRDHGVMALRQETTSAAIGADTRSSRLQHVPWLRDTNIKALPAAKRAEMARTSLVGTIHCLLAAGMLSGFPALELASLVWDGYLTAAAHVDAARAGDAASIAWVGLALLRLLHVAAINLCMSVFTYHFVLGFFSPSRHHSFKGFWAEYSACRLFAQLMLLTSLQALFAWPRLFDGLPLLRLVSLAAAAAHAASALVFCVRNSLLCLRNAEYSEAELAAIFDKWRGNEAAVQTLLDAQLAFIARIQAQLFHVGNDAAAKPPHSRWLLMHQMMILCKFRSSGDLPVPASPRRKLHEN
ncbi:hypothetical protein AB1Y20_014040 [Prymnesium parvum]|uniref:Uncharacterized protein n=1 Tax=Prymnesium parvum TaxID=97485 RepID=A0AB34IFV8_PRYPA